MIIKRIGMTIAAFIFSLSAMAGGIAQTIQINTYLSSFVGKPKWLLIIRDVDNGVSIPYEYTVTRGTNFWLASTQSSNYLITASVMHFTTYNSRKNTYKEHRINNFCGLESNGRVIRGKTFYITLSGMLSPNPRTVNCQVSRF